MKQHTLENHIYNMDCLAGCELLEAGSVDFIIADPPFYRVKGDFDFSFQSFEEYKEKLKEWVEKRSVSGRSSYRRRCFGSR